MTPSLISASFDQMQARQVRLIEQAARLGPVHVLLWDDALVKRLTGQPPRFPLEERQYIAAAIRWVNRITVLDRLDGAESLPAEHVSERAHWVVDAVDDTPARREFARRHGLDYHPVAGSTLERLPDPPEPMPRDGDQTRRVLVTGCYDWFHSGHVRFFEEVSTMGELFVVVGHDANTRLLKGEGHPMFPARVRRYMVGSIRHVRQAVVSTGDGWLDAEPEIERIRPDIYAVNDDGDRAEKRRFCRQRGIDYRVLQRAPKQGLPRRESTTLRGY